MDTQSSISEIFLVRLGYRIDSGFSIANGLGRYYDSGGIVPVFCQKGVHSSILYLVFRDVKAARTFEAELEAVSVLRAVQPLRVSAAQSTANLCTRFPTTAFPYLELHSYLPRAPGSAFMHLTPPFHEIDMTFQAGPMPQIGEQHT
jgi:hypothetical protein